jgi:hypothetical protein
MKSVKESVLEVVQDLPDECTWDDVMYRLYVRQKIATALQASESGDVVTHEEVFAEFESEQ